MNIEALLAPERTLVVKEAYTKKRVLDTISKLLASSSPEVDSKSLLQQFIARERLGSTGVGYGVALPHIRLSEINEPQGALIFLEQPLDFDSPDTIAVDIFFGLIVPENASEEHLQILAKLASLFNDESFRQQLRQCKTDTELYQTITTIPLKA